MYLDDLYKAVLGFCIFSINQGFFEHGIILGIKLIF